MNLYTDLQVRCPFNREHVVSDKQLKWHMVRCKCENSWILSNPGKQIFRCHRNWQHIFFSEAELKAHNEVGVCNRDDHNQTLEQVSTEPKKKKKSPRPNMSRSQSKSLSPLEDSCLLGKRTKAPA